jgi:hypothetical protein
VTGKCGSRSSAIGYGLTVVNDSLRDHRLKVIVIDTTSSTHDALNFLKSYEYVVISDGYDCPSVHLHTPRQSRQPPIRLLPNHILNRTLILRSNVLLFQRRRTHVIVPIHGLLQTIILPSKKVVSMCREARRVAA